MAGLPSIDASNLEPVLDHGITSVFVAGALIFVAYEGFRLITNAAIMIAVLVVPVLQRNIASKTARRL